MTDTDAWASLGEQLASRPPIRRPWARLFVPDLALCLAALAMFCSLVFFDAPQNLFRDSATGLEIQTGERILDTHSLPRADPFSFVHTGRRWIVTNWGADVILGTVDRLTGLGGVAWLALLGLGVATWLWVRLHWAAGGNFFFTLALFIPFLAMLRDHLRATSWLAGWIFLLAFLAYFEKVQPRFVLRSFAGFALAAALWANLDSSFLLLPIIAMLYAIGHVVRPLLWTLDTKEEWRRAKWFAWVAVVTLASGWLSNPYGMHFPGGSRSAPLPLFTLGLICAGGVLALAQTKVAHFLLAFLLAGFTLAWPVHAPFLVLLLPLANGAITGALRKSRNLRPALRKRVTGFLQYSDHVRLRDARFAGLLWSAFGALLLMGWLALPVVAVRTGLPPSEFPVYASAEFAVLPENVRLLAPPQYGDYLIYRFKGRLPVFVHSGMDGFDDLTQMRRGWIGQIQTFGFTHALLPVDSPLAQALEGMGWTPLFEDDASILLRRNSTVPIGQQE